MQAVILGAGLGTRLRPITNTVPKVLLPVFDRPLLEYTLKYLQKNGIDQVAMNIHHLADQVQSYAGTSSLCRELKVAINREPEILGTGGGLKGLEKFIAADDFVVYNSDVVTDLDLTSAIACHRKSKAMVTLLLHDCPQFNKITLDPHNAITAIIDEPDQPVAREKQWAFIGVAVMQRRIFTYLAPHGFQDIKDVYKRLIAQRDGSIAGCPLEGHYWRDIGNIESYWQLYRDIIVDKKYILSGFTPPKGMQYCSAQARVGPSVVMGGFNAVGAGAVLEQGEYENCVVMPKTVRNTSGVVRNSIVGDNFLCEVKRC
jgi:NDP-sugar pyrophosphorylase family protein